MLKIIYSIIIMVLCIKVGGGFMAAEDLGLDDQGPGDASALGLAVLFQPEAPIDPEPGGAGTLERVPARRCRGHSKGKILLDFMLFIRRL